MNYLVTGGAGFIGGAIADRLMSEGHTITIVDNLRTGYIENIPDGARFVEGDCSSEDTIALLGNEKYDAIFHIAGQSSGEISFEDPLYDLNSNALSTLVLMQFAVRTGCERFVFASTVSAYGQYVGTGQFKETDPLKPISFYAVGKIASEYYMKIYERNYGLKTTALRYFNVYGVGQNLANLKQGMLSIYLKQFVDNDYKEVLVKGSLERFRDLIYIDDVVNITIGVLENPDTFGEAINVGTGVKTSVDDMIKKIKSALGSEKSVVTDKGTLGDATGHYADTDKLKKIYKNKFVTLDEGLEKMIAWVKAGNHRS
jgi:UDP-glucose 4-epimerase